MSLIVETGSIIANANSYIDLTFANTYHSTYGNDAWDATGTSDTTNTTALIIATQALDALYGPRYDSIIPVGSSQSLLWPRLIFWDKHNRIRQTGTIPNELKQAQAEFALLYTQGIDLFPQLNANSQIGERLEKIGELMTKTVYIKPTAVANFRKVDLIMFPILKGGSTGVRTR